MILQKISIFFAIKELKMRIEQKDAYQNAALLFYANIARSALPNPNQLLKAIDNPLIVKKHELESIFTLIQNIYIEHTEKVNLLKQQLNTTETEYRNILEPYEKCYLVWLGTIGAGISTSRLNDVRNIWHKLLESLQYLPAILEKESELDYILGENFMNEANKVELLEIASYVPSIFNEQQS